MSQNNFVVQDVVAHIHDEEDYQFKRSTGHIFQKITKNLWMYGFILALSLGVGYSAVYLADSANRPAQGDENSMISGLKAAGAAGGLGNLSNDQKRELLKQLQSAGGGQ